MGAIFKIAYDITMGHEGDYANNPKDTGGETWKGVARNKNPKWGGWTIVDQLRKQKGFPGNLATSEELQVFVLDLYKKQYWDCYQLDKVNSQSIANEIFDTGVNMGTGTASKFLQRAINVVTSDNLTVDGGIGTKTLTSVNSLNDSKVKLVVKVLNVLQGSYYIDLVERKPEQRIFVPSWFSRVNL